MKCLVARLALAISACSFFPGLAAMESEQKSGGMSTRFNDVSELFKQASQALCAKATRKNSCTADRYQDLPKGRDGITPVLFLHFLFNAAVRDQATPTNNTANIAAEHVRDCNCPHDIRSKAFACLMRYLEATPDCVPDASLLDAARSITTDTTFLDQGRMHAFSFFSLLVKRNMLPETFDISKILEAAQELVNGLDAEKQACSAFEKIRD